MDVDIAAVAAAVGLQQQRIDHRVGRGSLVWNHGEDLALGRVDNGKFQ